MHPQDGEKILGPNIQGKVVNAPPGTECTPEAERESNFLEEIGEIWTVGRLFR